MQRAPLVLFGIAALISIFLSIPEEMTTQYYDWGELVTRTFYRSKWDLMFSFGEYAPYFVLFVIGCICLLASIVIGIIYLVNRKCELTITDQNVRGYTLFGKEVVLPLYMVSAYSTRKFLSTIAIATSSGITKFALIENYAEIGNVLSTQINKKQSNTSSSENHPAPQSNAMDNLIKLKSLLDAGIITEEEFNTKKKELLGL